MVVVSLAPGAHQSRLQSPRTPTALLVMGCAVFVFPASVLGLGLCGTKPLTVWITVWKILKEMGIPDHLTCLLRNLYAGQEATVRTGHGSTDRFQIGKGVRQGCILSPWLFNFYTEYIMRNAGLEETQAEMKIAGRNISNLDMQMTPPLW